MSAKNRQRMGYRRIVQLLVYLVIIPAALLLSLGIVMMFLREYQLNLLMGILIVSFVAWAVTGVILVWVFLRREANLSELQADFVSKVSHELRTPLTAIRLFAETLDRKKDDPETVEKCIRALDSETEKLSRRIERLLDWGRMEAGRRLYDLRPESVGDIVRGALDAFAPVRTDGAIELDCNIDEHLPMVLADRGAIIDALLNLLSNAHKYGGTPPKIRVHAGRAPKNRIFIEVTDNGEGIPRPEHRRIFEKFYRIDDRLSRKREGSGLGLAIVNHIIRGHKGSVAVESTPGKGSTFRISLNAVTAEESATSAPDVRDSAATPDVP
jgi:two-component system phosphate regulon sensor histidine kinase PhoR